MKGRVSQTTELLVAGAGPVGLFAALCAAQAGLEVTILDQGERSFDHGYATLLHPSTLRLLHQHGLDRELRSKGQLLTSLGLHGNTASRLELKLPAPALALPQALLEDGLLRALKRRGVSVLRPVEARSLEQDDSGVHVTAARRELVTLGSPANYSEWQSGASFVLHAAYVIGADGYDSRLRAALGIEPTTHGASESFALFESATDAALEPCMDIGFTGGLVSYSVPLARGRVRFGFQLATGLDVKPDAEQLRSLASQRLPWFTRDYSHMDWSTVTHFERRLAEPLGRGRVWLAGDAAHVTSPIGGQSMNIGLLEALELVDRIHACLRGKVSPESLQDYDRTRRKEWHRLFSQQVNFELLPHAPGWLAPLARRVPALLPASGAELDELLGELGVTAMD